MKKVFLITSLAFIILLGNATAQNCTMKGTLSSSSVSLNPRDPDFRDECNVYVSAKNDGTCGWEKGKVKVMYRLVSYPTKAPRPSGVIVGGTSDLENTVFPKATGKFKPFDLPPPEYHGEYVYSFYLIDKDNKKLSNEVRVTINWD